MNVKDVDQTSWSEFAPDFQHLWVFRNFANFTSASITSEIVVSSPVFQYGGGDSWKLEYRPVEGLKQPPTVQVYWKGVPNKRRVEVLISVNFVDKNNDVYVVNESNMQTKLINVDCYADRWNILTTFVVPYKVSHHLSSLLHEGNLRLLVCFWRIEPGRCVELCPKVPTSGISTLSGDLKGVFQDPILSDVTIFAGPETFHVHKIILIGRSNTFKRMFTAGMSEAVTNTVKMDDFPVEVVRGMLEFIYTDTSEINLELAWDFVRIAEMYELQGLKIAAETILMNNLDAETVLEDFRLSIVYQCETLKRTAIGFIDMHKLPVVENQVLEDLAKTNWQDVAELLTSVRR